jgi:hypothetical protein
MSIFVVCPGCRKRFEVSEQFAGKTGPCPSCKTPIKIPKVEDQVVVHGPEDAPPGKTRTGRAPPKPVARKDARFQPLLAAIIAGASLVVMAAAFFARGLLADSTWTAWLLRAVGLLLVSPPLVIGGYAFLRDDELEPYRGKELYLRAGIVALVFVVLWGAFGVVENTVLSADPDSIWQWLIVAPPFFVVGALAALASLDLDFGSGFFLYSFYVVVTVLLRWLAGLDWIWNAGVPLLD